MNVIYFFAKRQAQRFIGCLSIIAMIFLNFAIAADLPVYNKPFTLAITHPPTALDPQWKESVEANRVILDHLLEPLYHLGNHGEVERLLIAEETVEDSNNWLFTLKSGVKFHDGSLLDSDDVIAVLDRLYQQDKSNASRQFLGEGLRYEKVGKQQFRITTPTPDPVLPARLNAVYITPAHQLVADQPTAPDVTQVIGTGPYQLIARDRLEHFEFKAFADYHGPQPYLQQVVINIVNTQEAALQSFIEGKTDLAEGVAPHDIDKIIMRRSAQFRAPTGTALYFLALDQYRNQPPDMLSHDGQALTKNPLKDHRVREAISKAIDREALVKQFFGRTGFGGTGAVPSGQLVPEDYRGYVPGLQPDVMRRDRARALLREAGYPQGFRWVLHDKHARRPILEAIAAMLSEVGIQTTVETLKPSEHYSRLYKHEFSAGFSAYTTYGSVRDMLEDLIAGSGSANAGRYHNLKLDQALLAAKQQFDADLRYRDYGYLNEQAMRDYAIIPLYFINDIWAIRENMFFNPPATGRTLAQYVYPTDE